jgi:hypothetical protein
MIEVIALLFKISFSLGMGAVIIVVGWKILDTLLKFLGDVFVEVLLFIDKLFKT